jgi:uncharacterized membrane protein YccC
MTDAANRSAPAADPVAVSSRQVALVDALCAAGGPLLFAIRLWASVCLALFVAFWLELDNPFWAGTSAAIVCQPQLGASLRKGWFRMIGTVVGATMVVVLTAWFPQDRFGFLVALALWGGICAFTATVLHNFASYAAALAGYTAAIIAADNLGATGGPSPDIFMLAVTRASEICNGIVCAGIVLAATDLGGAERRLAASFANLMIGIAQGFTRVLTLAGPQLPDTQTERREFVRRVVALDPMVDQALGESSRARYYAPTLQAAVHGLFRALDGWRGVATHLRRLPDDDRQVEPILRSIPVQLRSPQYAGLPARWMDNPLALRRTCDEAAQALLALPAGTPSLRLIADETAKVLAGMARVLDGLALLVNAPGPASPGDRGFRLSPPDWLPALVNGGRVFIAISMVELFWVLTAWPNGAVAIVFAAIVLLLLSPKGDLAFGGAIALALGAVGGVLGAAMIKFAVLPAFQTFPAFCFAIGIFLVPVGFAMAKAHSRQQIALTAVVTAMLLSFVPLLAPTNEMSYDTAQFYNSAMAIVAGCAVAPLAFRLLPQPSPALRARRLLSLSLRDLRRLAIASPPPRAPDWEGRMYGRLAALPDQAEPLQRARLLAALSVGSEIIRLRCMAVRLGVPPELGAALEAFAHANSGVAIARLNQLDRRLAVGFDHAPETAIALQARARILVISEALAQHSSYFDAGGSA